VSRSQSEARESVARICAWGGRMGAWSRVESNCAASGVDVAVLSVAACMLLSAVLRGA